ncbi:hypothetical protein DFH07DRAFT_764424 [Mycena maculata]|uniref:Uncharacterized protein n=1 Tax=Mycena maculata TaxID=230809 RepID=A0AAD7KD08_9AGAR|nr:hypothetical protein DFH07DRAFT_764424 [Mycena maculata]
MFKKRSTVRRVFETVVYEEESPIQVKMVKMDDDAKKSDPCDLSQERKVQVADVHKHAVNLPAYYGPITAYLQLAVVEYTVALLVLIHELHNVVRLDRVGILKAQHCRGVIDRPQEVPPKAGPEKWLFEAENACLKDPDEWLFEAGFEENLGPAFDGASRGLIDSGVEMARFGPEIGSNMDWTELNTKFRCSVQRTVNLNRTFVSTFSQEEGGSNREPNLNLRPTSNTKFP